MTKCFASCRLHQQHTISQILSHGRKRNIWWRRFMQHRSPSGRSLHTDDSRIGEDCHIRKEWLQNPFPLWVPQHLLPCALLFSSFINTGFRGRKSISLICYGMNVIKLLGSYCVLVQLNFQIFYFIPHITDFLCTLNYKILVKYVFGSCWLSLCEQIEL